MKRSLVIIFAIIAVIAVSLAAGPRSAQAATPVLKAGMKGDDVVDLQQKLKKLGYFNEECTGYFGEVTEAAVIAFQREYNISADGVFGNESYKLLASLTADTITDTLQIVQGLYTRAEILELQQYLYDLGFMSVEPTGFYGELTVDAAKRYQKKYKLTVDGIVGRETFDSMRRVMASRNDPTGSIYMYDWWETVRFVASAGSTAKVIDVRTGNTFNVRINCGTNHFDVETLTAEDTAKFRACYGGADSWNRRPVVFICNGYTMAASMNGYPHAGNDSVAYGAWCSWRSGGYAAGSNMDYVKGNKINGVFCIHFKNSSTHGTGLVCRYHQACVREAAAYIASQDW